MFKGFRHFIARGNIVDLATGVIIGVAFGAIIDSLVKDIITPMLGLLGGQPDFSAVKIGPVAVGSFVNAILAFLIKAVGVYVFIVLPFTRLSAKLVHEPPVPAAPTPTQSEVYLKEIRDALVRPDQPRSSAVQ